MAAAYEKIDFPRWCPTSASRLALHGYCSTGAGRSVQRAGSVQVALDGARRQSLVMLGPGLKERSRNGCVKAKQTETEQNKILKKIK